MALDQLQKWRVDMLATNGGFSDRFIASVVFGTRPDAVTDVQKSQVTNYRIRARKLLTDWREGRTVLAKEHSRRATTPPARVQRRKRSRKAA